MDRQAEASRTQTAAPAVAASEDKVVVQTEELTKKYGDFVAVDGLNLQVHEGEIFGLLGPNGAGKTTAILMMMGLTEPSSGQVRVCGFDPVRQPLQVKRVVGYLPEHVGFYGDLTGRENLRYTARLNGLRQRVANERIDALLATVGLTEAADQKVAEFSHGMRQRLGIADVLVKAPQLVILDEPTLGIDPDGVNHVLNLIMQMSEEQGITVLLSSHQLHQVQRICHRVGIFVKGRMVAAGPIEELGRRVAEASGELVVEVTATPLTDALVASLWGIEGVREVERSGDLLVVRADHDITAQVSTAVARSGAALANLRLRGYGLEDIYFKYFREGG